MPNLVATYYVESCDTSEFVKERGFVKEWAYIKIVIAQEHIYP